MTASQIRSVAVMQPTFLPWMGYFALMSEVDAFVFLDDVQFVKRSWQRRNRLAGPNGEVVVGLPVAGKPSRPLLSEARLADQPIVEEIMPRIEGCLGKAPHWPLLEAMLERAFTRIPEGLSAVNIQLIRDMAEALNFTPQIMVSSQMNLPQVDRASRFPTICRALGATRYHSPVGSAEYLAEDRPFDGTEITLTFQNFHHPVYDQGKGAFLSHMAAADAFARLGPEATRDLILSGVHSPLSETELRERQDADGRSG